MKMLLRKALLTYRPIDTRLRRLPSYARLSRMLQQRYNIMMSDQRNIVISDQDSIMMSDQDNSVISDQDNMMMPDQDNSPAPAKEKIPAPGKEKIRAKSKSPGQSKGDAAAAYYAANIDRVSPSPDTILFECYWGKKFGESPLALYRELVRTHPRGSFRIHWTVAGNAQPPAEIAANPDVTLVRVRSKEYGHALLASGLLVNNVTFPPYFIRRPGQRYCNTWHGVPMKAMGRDMAAPMISMANTQRNFLQADLLLEMSDFYHEAMFHSYYVEQLAARSLLPCGAPRVDDVLTPRIPAAELRAQIGIAEGQTVVLFAPTWRGNSTAIDPVFGDQARLWAQIARELGEDHFVLFSAHQMVKVDKAEPVPNGALLPENTNINDVLTVVDVMVSDYSSIIFDFLPADRPIVLFTPDIEQYRQDRGLYLEPTDLPCAETCDLPGLIAAIRAARPPSDFPGWPEMQTRFVPLEDGQAAVTALAALLAPVAMGPQREPNRRQRLLIAPGGLVPNGITTSLKNLIANLDYDRYDPYILIEAAVMDQDVARRQQFEEFDSRCNWILRSGDMLLTAEEKPIYHAFRRGDDWLGDAEMAVIRRIFERENARVLGTARFDVSIEFGGYAPFWTALMACSNATRKVCYQHNHLWAEYTNLDASRNQRQLYGVFLTYGWFDQIVAVSDETRMVNETHLARFYPDGSKACTVRNTMNMARVLERKRLPVVLAHPAVAPLFQSPELFRFIALGRLSPEKRYDRMIGALARIAPEHPNAVLLICGSGPLKDKLLQFARRKGVAEQVRFLGQVHNPYPLLANADVCVMSSDYEGQPMTLLEALSLGVPCIGTDIPGIRSVLKDGRGHITDPTEEAFAATMKAAIEGRLPKFVAADIGGEYTDTTMDEFYRNVCGR
ncbi:glycosyltransferase [Sedimentitalea todarodis]|uniref:Glycosyltransferase n=1 Tax=Sedimentitalea todarodis TaxID=1631240 RepID=A0ABU3VJZ3_9RHOB|nr:glycosyltransferase [Sedimentitalea todarodis]MDU9006517.1 glycosyltransferase [Sedimentitalea todarodis]